jgi:hypothetical protein
MDNGDLLLTIRTTKHKSLTKNSILRGKLFTSLTAFE